MDKILKWNDKLGLKNYADQLLKAHPELNKKYPTPRCKDRTYLVDFQDIEAKGGAGLLRSQPLKKNERNFYKALSVDYNIVDIVFNLDFQPILEKLTSKQKFVFERRIVGYTQQEISKMMNITRKNVVKHLDLMKNKIKKYWEARWEIF